MLAKDAQKCAKCVRMNAEKCPKGNGYQYNKKQPWLFFIVAKAAHNIKANNSSDSNNSGSIAKTALVTI